MKTKEKIGHKAVSDRTPCEIYIRLNASWSTLKDQCRCMTNRMRDNERASNG